jgi:3-oxoadipate enol-lactonase
MIENVNGFKMAYTDHGSGIPLVFVHGYPLSRRMWDPQVEALSDIARVIVPDLRGHGESEAIPGPYSMELFADDLAALLDKLHIQEKIVLCGLSMGGYVAFAFFRKYAPHLAGLVLTATRAADDSPQARAGRDQAAETARQNGIVPIAEGMITRLLATGRAQSDPQLAEQARSIMHTISLEGMLGDLAGLKSRPDSRPLLGKICLPVLVVHGSEDQIVPLEEAKAMASSIPESRLEVILSAGHLLNMEQPELFNACLREYLLSLPKEM